jgi:UDP-glucose 4-epimerase
VTEVACGIRDKLIVNGNDYNTHDGTCVRDYIHVQDLAVAHVKALDFLLDNKVKDVFNVGTGKGLSVLDIINNFQEANDLKLNYVLRARRSLSKETTKTSRKNSSKCAERWKTKIEKSLPRKRPF